MDMLTGLHQLQWEGMTREMYIWGNVQARQLCASTPMLQLQSHTAGSLLQTDLDPAGPMDTWHY